jgi:protein gp37
MTSIEWTERTWNPIVGCTIATRGCTNCYAMRAAWRMANNPQTPQYHSTAKLVNGNPVWTGKMNRAPKALLEPLKRRKPTTYFVNSMGDLFHEDIPDEWIDEVFAVMALCPQHTFQVLTKRAERMRDWCNRTKAGDFVGAPTHEIAFNAEMERPGTINAESALRVQDQRFIFHTWPLANVWLGVSTEDQKSADERIPLLLDTPAAIRFVSAEPLLGPVNLLVTDRHGHDICALRGIGVDPTDPDGPDEFYRTNKLDWVIVGGESGPGARPMHPDWAVDLISQCKWAGVPVLFKQWGEHLPAQLWNTHAAPAPTIEHEGERYMKCGKKRAGRFIPPWGYLDEMPTAPRWRG